jgi:uncharacterized protein YukE
MFFMELNPVQQVLSQVMTQQKTCTSHQDIIGGLPAKVVGPQGWEGKDADEFGKDTMRKVVPALAELAAAFAGVNLNLTQAVDALNQADQAVSGIVSELQGVFDQI